MQLSSLTDFLETVAPLELAEDWDNTGLLAGDPRQPVERVMTCLTVTQTTAEEAIRERADLVVSHHPIPFKPVSRLTSATTTGRLLWNLARHGVAVYSAHTAFDSAAHGINQQLSERLGLADVAPLVPHPGGLGTGRMGSLAEPVPLATLSARVRGALGIEHCQTVGEPDRRVGRVAIGCGAADDLLDAAKALRCDAMLLGETRFHACLEAEDAGIGLILVGHYASERFAMETLADCLAAAFPTLAVWPSRDERDPIRWE